MVNNQRSLVQKLLHHHYPTTFSDYLRACLAFSKDTQDWLVLDDQKQYVTDIFGGDFSRLWCETTNNDRYGLDLVWAFRMDTEEIHKHAKAAFIHIFDSLTERALEEGWYSDYLFLSPCVDLGDDDAVLIDFIGPKAYAKLDKYPSTPYGASFYVNIQQVELNNPDCDWSCFDWRLIGAPTIIYENEYGYWESL